MKPDEAVAILNRLGEKGILGKSALKEINKDIYAFLKDHPVDDGNSKSGRKI